MEGVLTGGCNCGGVRFEVHGPLGTASWCHCTRCRRRTGVGGSIQVAVDPSAVRIVQGQNLLRAWEPPDGRAKYFCSACGSSMWSRSRDGEQMAIRLDVFDTDPGVRASAHWFAASAVPWDPVPDDGLPVYP